MKAWLALLLAGPLFASASPFVPKSDADVVQRLPYRVDAAERARHAALARDPAQLPLAVAAARAALERSHVHGDPRELGAAQAALAPWWGRPGEPADVTLLRARVLQARHDFDTALSALRGLIAQADLAPEMRAQALLDAASIHQLRAELPEARALCEQLQPLAAVPAMACLAELSSLTGEGPAAARTLASLSPGRSVAPWLALMRAELAERMGDDTAAPLLYRTALAGADDVYTRAAYADWLLARGRAADALMVVERSADAEADALLLRRAIALRLLDRKNDAADTMRERLATADRREPGKHAREQARFALDVLQQPAEALKLAQANWSWQREPADAVLLLRAAQAAGRAGDSARQDLARFVRERGWQDVRLAALGQPT